MKDVILLPTYNERENIKIIIPEIFKLYSDFSILVIDDNSPDKTAQAVEELMEKFPKLSILKRREKTGLGDAYIEAMRRVINDKEVRSVITMDADGSHSPEYLTDFIANIVNFDLIIGSRYVNRGEIESWEAWRKSLSRLGNLYVKFLTGLPINDFTAGFMCIRREFLEKIDFSRISSSGYSFLIELKFYLINDCKAKVKEVPIVFKSRRGGESKISNQIIREGVLVPWRILLRRIWKR